MWNLKASVSVLAGVLLCVSAACSSNDDSGDAAATGGVSSVGGGSAGLGGSTTSTGGSVSVGGSVSASGGAIASGGSSSGASAGGAPPTGGAAGTSGSGGSSGASAGAGGANAGAGGTLAAQGGSAGVAGAAAGSGGVGPATVLERAEVLRLMRLVADYYLQSFGTNYDKSWLRSTFYTGLLAAYRTTMDQKYLTAAKTWGADGGWRQATANSIDGHEGQARHADNHACFQSYAETYMLDPVPANDVMLTTATSIFDSMVSSPKTGRTEWSWCDALFMAPPALVRAGVAKNKPAYISLMNDMFWDTKAYLFDPASGFFWRDNARRNTSFWSRGNGWVFAGIARILEYLPANDARRGDYEDLFRQMATALRNSQNQDDGFWRSNLLNPAEFSNRESSGTAFFCFGIAWGINNGVLDRATYLPVALKAWQGLVDDALTPEGLVGWVQGPAHAPGSAVRTGTNDYAGGAFLLSASEMIEL